MDANSDGRVTYNEFIKLWDLFKKEGGENMEENPKDVFRRIDKDNSGSLTVIEFCSEMGLKAIKF